MYNLIYNISQLYNIIDVDCVKYILDKKLIVSKYDFWEWCKLLTFANLY